MIAALKKTEQQITPELVASHGLKADEYQKILKILGREPNLVELGIFSVMWSEHCSYKSTRVHLKKLPTTGPQVICGPGENAGVIDIGDGQAAIFKMESHNHPSFIEPYQGAATGVGGILRDVFTMGARPIANLNALRFGDVSHPKTKHLMAGVVAGIGGYGNCVGVPTVGGECIFHPAYNGNILVNAMTVGVAQQDKIFYSKASGIGNSVVYVGSKTGRDGIHGATMSSAEFNEDSESKRPTVQVGDPFTEKLLIEACLELMQHDAIIAIQDMGAAGLTSSSLEMAGKGGTGIEMDLDRVPKREFGMTAYEIMLSESQERMLMVLKPEKEDFARAIFEKWGLSFAVVGKVTDTGRMILKREGQVVADLPIAPLSDEAPMYDRPHVPTAKREALDNAKLNLARNTLADLKTLLATPDLCSKRWIYQQYDHMVMGDTIVRPGGDAAVVRVHDTNKGLAMTADCTPRYCYADPVEGGKQAVVETWRNITATGGLPLAITNCLNFGNPEKPEIMGQIVGCLAGMSEACKALDYPIVSGNASLYNETNGNAILPTPAIGGVGLIKDLSKHTTIAFKQEGDVIAVIGETKGHLGQSIFLRELLKKEEGTPPVVNLAVEKKNGDFVRGLIEAGLINACHDVADGGLLVAVSEMAIASDLGAEIAAEGDAGYWFGEDQARYVITVKNANWQRLDEMAKAVGVPLAKLGTVKGDALVLGSEKAKVADLRKAHEDFLPNYMA
jgi:phosphoribosylformylglycinamidine synthase